MASLLVWVLEDQSRGAGPHLHFVLGRTTALEKAFARAFFRELKSAACMQGSATRRRTSGRYWSWVRTNRPGSATT